MLSLFPSSRITPDFTDIHVSNAVLSYFDYSDIKGIDVVTEIIEGGGLGQQPLEIQEAVERGINANSYLYPNFLDTEILPFSNFATPGITGGNCAGIASYTMRLHNKGSVPTSGEVTFNEALDKNVKEPFIGTLKWDIAKDAEN